MKIAILTTGRFHVCDLARELDALGHAVAFYSLVPPWRTRQFGLPGRCNRWLAPLVAPVLLTQRAAARTRWAETADHALAAALDFCASKVIERCDVLIGMSGLASATAAAARRRFGARIFIERGSRHILSQREILQALPRRPGSKPPVPEWAVRRELTDYDLADTVVVPSRHVVESFLERGFPQTRLFRNPYGVSLSMFPATRAPTGIGPTFIMTGAWSLRKGCDLLVEAWRQLPFESSLVHVGPVLDVPLPAEKRFTHVPAVDQSRLTKAYSSAHVFALASHEEGLSLVLPQALASGLHLVCTDRTGGADVAELTGCQSSVTVCPSGDVERLRQGMARATEKAVALSGLRDLLGPARAALSWESYGKRYDQALRERA